MNLNSINYESEFIMFNILTEQQVDHKITFQFETENNEILSNHFNYYNVCRKYSYFFVVNFY